MYTFPPIFAIFAFPYFHHDAFMHHALHVGLLDASVSVKFKSRDSTIALNQIFKI